MALYSYPNLGPFHPILNVIFSYVKDRIFNWIKWKIKRPCFY
jgi:hypothetical protein